MSEVHPVQLPDRLHLLLRSRKFWAAVIAITRIARGPRAGVDQQTSPPR